MAHTNVERQGSSLGMIAHVKQNSTTKGRQASMAHTNVERQGSSLGMIAHVKQNSTTKGRQASMAHTSVEATVKCTPASFQRVTTRWSMMDLKMLAMTHPRILLTIWETPLLIIISCFTGGSLCPSSCNV